MGTPVTGVEGAAHPVRIAPVERRAVRRRRSFEEHGVISVRIRPGRLVSLVDVSANGALIESERQLRPGALAEVQMSGRAHDVVLRGFVLRCAVFHLGPSGVLYRAAIGFEQLHPWFTFDVSAGYPVHGQEVSPNPVSWAAGSRLGV